MVSHHKLTTCSLSCQNSFSFAWLRNGNFRTWCTNMYLRIGSSLSTGATSPRGDWKGAPKRCSAVGELSSVISNLTWLPISSRLRSTDRSVLARTSKKEPPKRGKNLMEGQAGKTDSVLAFQLGDFSPRQPRDGRYLEGLCSQPSWVCFCG